MSDPGQGGTHGLYGDGSTPWSSRADAEAYLGRLKLLLAGLTRRPAR